MDETGYPVPNPAKPGCRGTFVSGHGCMLPMAVTIAVIAMGSRIPDYTEAEKEAMRDLVALGRHPLSKIPFRWRWVSGPEGRMVPAEPERRS